jgi:hypothetical protein
MFCTDSQTYEAIYLTDLLLFLQKHKAKKDTFQIKKPNDIFNKLYVSWK